MTAFLLTWKESGWPHENIVRMVDTMNSQGYVDEPWRIAAHKLAKPGDRVWVLKQGRRPRGVFGVGEIVAPPLRGDAGNGKIQWMASIRFTSLVDPKVTFLVGELDTIRVLKPTQINAQASGYPLEPEQSAALEELLATNRPVELGGSGDWTKEEVRAIVADYFSMLDAELGGRSYSKSEHRNALRQTVQRSPGSIERKHQNISAVLRKLGLPWIHGYKPLPNFQDALLDAIRVRLETRAAQLDQIVSLSLPSEIDLTTVFVAPPMPVEPKTRSRSLEGIAKRFDPAARDAANRRLGATGEEFVMRVEVQRLKAIGKDDLAQKVRWTSRELGDGLGYDIDSFGDDGSPIYIEVKATKGPIETPFFLTENERQVAELKGAAF